MEKKISEVSGMLEAIPGILKYGKEMWVQLLTVEFRIYYLW